jgi:PKD repeat protein
LSEVNNALVNNPQDITVTASNGTTTETAIYRGTATLSTETINVVELSDATSSFSATITNNGTNNVTVVVSHDQAAGNVTLNYTYTELNISSSCFIASTLVCMEDGTVKAISEIEEGDLVLGESETNKVLKNDACYRHFERIYGFNGLGCFTTHNHAFLTTEGWKCISKPAALEIDGQIHYERIVGELQVGDTIIGFNESDTIVITSIDSRPSRPNDFPVYNLFLDGDHTYFADFLCVHNK